MYSDEIISEVWRNREAYAQKHQYDLKRMIADLKKRQNESLAKVVDRKNKKLNTRNPTPFETEV